MQCKLEECSASSGFLGSAGSIGRTVLSAPLCFAQAGLCARPVRCAVRSVQRTEPCRPVLDTAGAAGERPPGRFGLPLMGFQARAGSGATAATAVAPIMAVTPRVPWRALAGHRSGSPRPGARTRSPAWPAHQRRPHSGPWSRRVEHRLRLLRGLPAQPVRERARVEAHGLHPAGAVAATRAT